MGKLKHGKMNEQTHWQTGDMYYHVSLIHR